MNNKLEKQTKIKSNKSQQNDPSVWFSFVFVTAIVCCVLQEELRPEYEEALQEKKAKMKSQSKKKVACLSASLCVLHI